MFSTTQRLIGTPAGGGAAAPTSRIDAKGVAQSGTVAVPSGATSLTIKVQGNGGGGALTNLSATAYGGGAGGYSVKGPIDVTGEAGETLAWTLGSPGIGALNTQGLGTPGGSATVTSATLANWTGTITCNGGTGGTPYAPGEGGTATGGTSNTDGADGTQQTGGASGSLLSRSSGPGLPGKSGGGGGPGLYVPSEQFQYQGGDGGPGFILFEFS